MQSNCLLAQRLERLVAGADGVDCDVAVADQLDDGLRAASVVLDDEQVLHPPLDEALDVGRTPRCSASRLTGLLQVGERALAQRAARARVVDGDDMHRDVARASGRA